MKTKLNDNLSPEVMDLNLCYNIRVASHKEDNMCLFILRCTRWST